MAKPKKTINRPVVNKPLKPQDLPYCPPQLGQDYWVEDDILPNATAISERCFSRAPQHWTLGSPWRNETWPGMRSPHGLLPAELTHIEDWVKAQTGATKLWQVVTPEGASLSHNYIQLVGGQESGPRPHTDSRKLCHYAAVIYLTPHAPAHCGTSFYRLRLPDGTLSGNVCPPPYANLREALGIQGLPLEAWKEYLTVPNKFNRILLYRANLIHSASAYCGQAHRDKRMTIVFFWMAA